ncbi:MAG TPA: cell wall hydrolase [Allosphingosinicella sp.]|jgi:spore germination cell wall hydrolase CwlJ-like protein
MNRLLRAASFAAASFTFVFGAPSLAWELTGTPVTTEISPEPGIGAPPPAAAAPPVAAVEPAPPAAAEKPVRRNLAELVADHSSTQVADAEQECLAGAVYFEAKGEPLHGQLSVAEVVLNRARSGRFPASVCGVVKQRGQFSFIRGGRFPAIARTSLAWKRAVAIAHIAVQDLADGPAPKALFFHAKRVSPRWRLTRVAAVGNHIFYR